MQKKEYIVEKSKKIVDLLQDFGFGFADANRILRAKDVKINGKATKNNELVQIGDVIVVYYPDDMLSKKYEIVFENDEVLIVYKNSGIETAGEKGLETLLGVIAVHRLDRNTEGLVLFAKKQDVAEKLNNAFKKNLVNKTYITEVVGECLLENKIYKAFLIKDSDKAEVRIVPRQEKGAVEILTKVKVVDKGVQTSVLEVGLITGKTHQIRAHLAYLGYPIVGDGKYGKNEINKKFGQKTQKLACFRLKFDYLGIDCLNNKEFVRFPKWYYDKQK